MSEYDDNPYAAPQTERQLSPLRRAYRWACTAGITAFVEYFALSCGACAVGWYILTGVFGQPSESTARLIRGGLLVLCTVVSVALAVRASRVHDSDEKSDGH